MKIFLHPSREELSLPTILYALGDVFRLQIVARLANTEEKLACQDFFSNEMVAKSTLSYHFKVLREAGLVRMVPQGRRMQVSLRREDLEARFPGIIETVLTNYHQQQDGLLQYPGVERAEE